MEILVVGCGSEGAGDDAVGSEVVHLLARRHPRTDLRYALLPAPGLALLDVFEREKHIVFVDAVVSDRDPGSIVVAPLPARGVRLRSTVAAEGWGIDEVFALGRSLGRSVPRATILGIEVSGFESSCVLSEPVSQAMSYVLTNFDEVRARFTTRSLVTWTPWEAYADA